MAGESVGKANQDSAGCSISRIFLFSDDAAFAATNRSLTEGVGSYLTPSKPARRLGNAFAEKVGGYLMDQWHNNQTNPGGTSGSGVSSPVNGRTDSRKID